MLVQYDNVLFFVLLFIFILICIKNKDIQIYEKIVLYLSQKSNDKNNLLGGSMDNEEEAL